MAFQSNVRPNLTGAFAGDIVLAGPTRAQTGVIVSATEANNIIGRALTHVAAQDARFAVGGTGTFAGIFSGRNQYVSAEMRASMAVPNNTVVEAVTMTSGIAVMLDSSGAIGDAIAYKPDGTLVAAPGGTAPGGSTLIEGSKIVRHNIPAAGLAIVQLT